VFRVSSRVQSYIISLYNYVIKTVSLSLSVGVGAGEGVGVSGLGVTLGVSPGVGPVVGFPPLTSLDY